MNVAGWPDRAGRRDYGPAMHDERRVADPRSELGAQTLELLFWQLGGMGVTAPKLVLAIHPGPESPELLFGAFSWDDQVYLERAEPFPHFSLAFDAGDAILTFVSTAGGMDGVTRPLVLSHAQGGGLNNVDPLVVDVVMLSPLVARVAITNQAGTHLLVPFGVAFW